MVKLKYKTTDGLKKLNEALASTCQVVSEEPETVWPRGISMSDLIEELGSEKKKEVLFCGGNFYKVKEYKERVSGGPRVSVEIEKV